MAQIDLGKLKFQWKGQYADSTAYEIDDVVFDQGSAWVVVAVVANTNTSNPKENGAFELMQQGVQNLGAYSSSTTYYYGDIVTYNNGSYIRKNITASSNVVPTTTSTWDSLVGAPPGSVTTTSGDIAIRDNEATLTRLPIGTKGQKLTVKEDFLETFANNTDGVDYIVKAPTAWTANTAYALNDTVTADGGKMYICDQAGTSAASGSGPSGTGTDITDNGARWDYVQSSAARVANLELVGTSTNVGSGDYVTNASVTLTRGKEYTFVFPANSNTYSFKDTTVSGYETGTTGRLTTTQGVDVVSVTNGGTIKFTPSTDTSVLATSSIKIRDENASATTDEINITLVPQRFTPEWAGGAGDAALAFNDPNTDFEVGVGKTRVQGHDISLKKADPCATLFNSDYNTYTEDLRATPGWLSGFGKGQKYANSISGSCYRQGGIITSDGLPVNWGNPYHHSSYAYTYGMGLGVGNSWGTTAKTPNFSPSIIRVPLFFKKAIAGETDYAHFLTDINGADLGYTKNTMRPKIMEVHKSFTSGFALAENGILFMAGYNGYGISGNGNTSYNYYELNACPFYDDEGTQLAGSNYPKISQICYTGAPNNYTDGDYQTCVAIDTNGIVYTVGYNGCNQLGRNGTSNDAYFRAISSDKSAFGDEKVIYITCSEHSGTVAHMAAITETGKLYMWGYNGYGNVPNGTTTNVATPYNCSSDTNNSINGKTVEHVVLNSSGGHNITTILCTDGTVHVCGYMENYGVYAGCASTDGEYKSQTAQLTHGSTLWNSDNQKVIGLWQTGGRYPTTYLQTDGGDTGEPRFYAYGDNSYGCQGTGATTSLSGQSTTSCGTFAGGELVFQTFGDQETGTDNSRPNEVSGVRSTFEDSTHANYRQLKIGKIVKFATANYYQNQSGHAMALDENGQVYVVGYWEYKPCYTFERDDGAYFESSNNYTTKWIPLFTQGEPMVDIAFVGNNSTSEECWLLVGKSGTMYTGGSSSWYQNAATDQSSHSCQPFEINAYTGS